MQQAGECGKLGIYKPISGNHNTKRICSIEYGRIANMYYYLSHVTMRLWLESLDFMKTLCLPRNLPLLCVKRRGREDGPQYRRGVVAMGQVMHNPEKVFTG